MKRFVSCAGPQAGFTLFEILVTMMIAAAVIALAAPVIGRGMEEMRLRSAVKKTVAAMNYAGVRAVRQKRPYCVNAIAPGDLSVYECGTGDMKKLIPLPEGIGVEAQGQAVFYPGGGAEGGPFTVKDARHSFLVSAGLDGLVRAKAIENNGGHGLNR